MNIKDVYSINVGGEFCCKSRFGGEIRDSRVFPGRPTPDSRPAESTSAESTSAILSFFIFKHFFYLLFLFSFAHSSSYSSFFHRFFGDVASRVNLSCSLSFIPRAHMLILFFILLIQKRRNHAN